MSSNSSSFNFIQIGSSNRSNDVLRAEWWRTNNGVGRCMLLLRNVDQKYNGVFDVHDTIVISIVPPGGTATTMFRGRVDGPAVDLIGQDLESTWEEYIIVRGVDRWQDVLFHNDYEASYPASNTQIKHVLDDLFGFPPAISTNITYTAPVGATPVIGSLEFREGTSFLGTIQEMLRRGGWTSYVDDAYGFRAGAPGFDASAEILTNTGADKNIIQVAELRERDGDKLYNYVKLIGKNPMFDGYTEQNSASWTSLPGTTLVDSTLRRRVGTYSQRLYNDVASTAFMRHVLTAPVFDYTSWDFSKGEIGFWGRYDNQAAGGGAAPAAGSAGANMYVLGRLTDSAGGFIDYYGESSRLYIDEWGWCSFPLGSKIENTALTGADKWIYPFATGNFDWEHVTQMWFQLPRVSVSGYPSNFYIDGISLPVPVIAIEENAASQTSYRKRPLILSTPHLTTYNAIQKQATQLLSHHKDTGINYLKLTVEGNVNLHYAAQSVTVNIPEFTINNGIFYINELHHVAEPQKDVTGGYGFDYITEVELVPITGVAYDMSRLGDRQVYSPTQLGTWSGAGLGIK